MKTVKNSLMALCLMSLPFSAFAQEERKAADLWYAEQAENVKNMLTSDEDKAQAADYIKALYEMPTEKFVQYTKRGDLKVIKANVGRIDDQGDLHLEEVNNDSLKVRFALLAKAFGPQYGNKICPLYAFEGSKDASNYNSRIVYNYDLGGTSDYDVATYDPNTNVIDFIPGTPASNNQQTAGAVASKGSVPSAGAALPPGSIVESNGQQYEVIYDEDGKQSYRMLSNAGDGNVQKKKASRTETVEVVGDQNLLAQRGGSQQQSQSTGVQLLGSADDIIIKKVNGVERAYRKSPTGLVPDDENADLAVVERDGKEYIFSGQKAEVGPRNANKDGMRDAAGLDGNKGIGKHGGTWTGRGNGLAQYRGNGGFWPAGGGAVVIGCGGRPQPGPTFYCVNNDWIDGGGNANMYSWNNCQGCGGGGGPVKYGSSTW